MAFDFIDMIVNTGDEYLTGVFYKRRPVSASDVGVSFRYKQLDANAKVFDKVLGELRKDRATYSIKTNDDCAFVIGGYIKTQNGNIWEITELIANEEVKGSNEALRWFKTAKNAEISIRMIQVDDLYNLQGAYEKECVIHITSDVKMTGAVYEGGSDSFYAFTHDIYVTKGMSETIIVQLEDGSTKKIYVPSYKTGVSELNYKI